MNNDVTTSIQTSEPEDGDGKAATIIFPNRYGGRRSGHITGSGYTTQWTDITRILPNPSRNLRKLGKSTKEVYDEVESDSKVKAAIRAFNSGILSREFNIEQGGCPEDIYREILEVFDGLNTRSITSGALSAIANGYAVFEVNYTVGTGKLNSGKYIPSELVLRPYYNFGFDIDGNVYFRSRDSYDGELVELDYKIIVIQNSPTSDNPYGDSNLDACYWPVFIKKANIEFSVIFSERYGMPWPIIQYDSVVFEDEEQVNKLVDVITGMFQDGILVAPKEVGLSVSQTGSTSSAAIYQNSIDYWDSIISQVWLGHTGAMEGTPGALGDQKSAVNVRTDLVEAGSELAETALNTVIAYINDLCYGLPIHHLPRAVLRPQIGFDRGKLERDTGLARDHGLIFNKEHFETEYGLDSKSFVMPSSNPGDQIRSTVAGLSMLYTYQSGLKTGAISREMCMEAVMIYYSYDEETAARLFPIATEITPPALFSKPGTFVPDDSAGELTTGQEALDSIVTDLTDDDDVNDHIRKNILDNLKGLTESQMNAFLESEEGFNSILDTTPFEDALTRAAFTSYLIGTTLEETKP